MNNIKKILSGEFLNHDFLRKNIGYVLFIIGIFFFYIVLGSYGDLRVGERESLKNKVNDLGEKSIIYESELMQQSLQSSVYEEIKKRHLNLIKHQEPIKIIFVTENKINGRKKKNNK